MSFGTVAGVQATETLITTTLRNIAKGQNLASSREEEEQGGNGGGREVHFVLVV
jgi:hypothetical protein